jgi:uncharacterized membrane protein YidH (DUF202 family)
MTSYEAEGREPSLAAERTDLAWSRSGLALLACGAVLLRGLAQVHQDVAAGVCVLALGLATYVLGWSHARRRRARSMYRTTTKDLLPISVGVALIAVAGIFIAFVPR